MERERAWLLKEKYGGISCPQFEDDVKRLDAGEPLAYVIGWVDFLGVRIDLSYRPLIPRPETEFWCEKLIARTKERQNGLSRPISLLDLCSGSGCIALAVSRHVHDCAITASDISSFAISQLEKNIQTLGATNIRVIHSDLFRELNGQFDFIAANPPYLDRTSSEVDPSVLNYEPDEALFADSGTSLIERIIRESDAFLAPKGELWVEFEKGQDKALREYAAGYFRDIEILADQFAVARVLILKKP